TTASERSLARAPPFSRSWSCPVTVPASTRAASSARSSTGVERTLTSRRGRNRSTAVTLHPRMTGLSLLLLASLETLSGEDALRHARLLAALGPHAFGSPRARAAAEYVAAELRSAGLQDVKLQPFESDSLKGQNVIGVLRGPGSEFVVLSAHHDSSPDAPGAYDDGGGVGVLIEVARALAQRKDRARTFVFASFDGEESESQTKTHAAGSRAYVQSLGAEARQLVA